MTTQPGSTIQRLEMPSTKVASPVTIDLLAPATPPAGAPVLVWLHGGDGPDGFAARTKPAFDRCWADGTLPPLWVVVPHSTRSFWLDGVGEDAAWESMLAEELLPFVRAALDAGEVALVGGISMGGMGSLRLAFRHSHLFQAVAAIEPAVESTAEWGEIPLREKVHRGAGVVEALLGDPVDPVRFRHNHPLAVMERHAVEIAANGLDIYLECGDQDMFNLHHGVEALHRRLWECGLRHEYRSVRGANHVGRSVGPRTVDALTFLGRSLRGQEDDPELDAVVGIVSELHVASGLRRSTQVAGPAGQIEVWEYGDGAPVVLIPSLGRGAADNRDRPVPGQRGAPAGGRISTARHESPG